MNIAVIIPIYNESKIINTILCDPGFKKYTVIIINDGSKEKLELNTIHHQFYLLTHSKNLGQGAALQTGMEYCKFLKVDIAVHFDGDGQHQVSDIERLIKPLINKEADVVIGSRFLPGEKRSGRSKIPRLKIIILKLAKVVQFIFTGINLSDSQNGLRALNAKALSTINIKQNRMAHAIEIIESCVKEKLVIKEVPVNILYSAYSMDKGQKIYNGLLIFLRLLFERINLILTIIFIAVVLLVFAKLTAIINTAYFYCAGVVISVFAIFFLCYNYNDKKKQKETIRVRGLALNNAN